jgi:hypothetical protein
LWLYGCAVLGYDAVRGCDVPHATPEGWLADDWRAATAEPRRYGFHATLKAPFRLAEGRTEADLRHAMEAFSVGREPAQLGTLRVATIGNFVALVPQEQGHELLALAAAIVTTFEPLRAPLSAEDYARRRPEALPARERAYLDRFGYPYVLDAFRFHMTLSGRLPPERIDQTRKALAFWRRPRSGDDAIAPRRGAGSPGSSLAATGRAAADRPPCALGDHSSSAP